MGGFKQAFQYKMKTMVITSLISMKYSCPLDYGYDSFCTLNRAHIAHLFILQLTRIYNSEICKCHGMVMKKDRREGIGGKEKTPPSTNPCTRIRRTFFLNKAYVSSATKLRWGQTTLNFGQRQCYKEEKWEMNYDDECEVHLVFKLLNTSLTLHDFLTLSLLMDKWNQTAFFFTFSFHDDLRPAPSKISKFESQ